MSQDEKVFVIIYHPDCKASQKLISMIPKESNFKLYDVRTTKIPPSIKSVPAGIYDSEVICGKPLFDRVEKMINGPKSVDIFGKQMAGFINDGSNFTLNTNFTPLNNGSDGFTGVPTYDESQQRTLESIKTERT